MQVGTSNMTTGPSTSCAGVAHSWYMYDSVYHYLGEMYREFCVFLYDLQFKLLTTYHNVCRGEFSGR